METVSADLAVGHVGLITETTDPGNWPAVSTIAVASAVMPHVWFRICARTITWNRSAHGGLPDGGWQ